MPAPAVIPAPIVYMKVAAVKKLIVGLLKYLSFDSCSFLKESFGVLLKIVSRAKDHIVFLLI